MTRVALAGGGTAGHTSPLIATALELQRLDPETEVVCIGTSKGLETTVIPAAGLPLELITPVPLPRSLSWDLVRLPWTLTRSVTEARRILKQHGAEVLVGFGGYVSIPAYIAARTLGVPIVVHEANKLPGIANRVGARWAAVVATTFAETELPGGRVLGMPMAREIAHPAINKAEARSRFGLAPDRPTLLVSGGSQGAVRINDAVAAARDALLAGGVQILHVLGAKNFDDSHRVVEHPTGARYVPVAYVDHMAEAYGAADLMLGRAGAATVMETAAAGLPVVFVPLPWGNGEQARNAESLVEAGAGTMIRDAELDGATLVQHVLPRITDPDGLRTMSQAARQHHPPDAAEALARAVLAVAEGSQETRPE